MFKMMRAMFLSLQSSRADGILRRRVLFLPRVRIGAYQPDVGESTRMRVRARPVRSFPHVGENVQAFSDCPDANARYTIFDDEWFDSGWQVLSLTGYRGTA